MRQASRTLKQGKNLIISGLAESKKEHGVEVLGKLEVGLDELQQIVEDRDRDAVAPKQKELLNYVGRWILWPLLHYIHHADDCILLLFLEHTWDEWCWTKFSFKRKQYQIILSRILCFSCIGITRGCIGVTNKSCTKLIAETKEV